MRHRWTTAMLLPLLSASMIACGDTTGPEEQDLVNVLLDFCSDDTPVFLAVQNEDGPFERVLPNAEGTFSLDVAPQFTLAIVRQQGSLFSTEYLWAAPADVESLNGVSCAEQFGAKTLTGTVANVPAGSAAMVTMAGAFDYAVSPDAAYVLAGLPSGPLDLIAQRELVGATTVVPDKIIIRRAQDRTANSAIPVLDFTAAEAQNVAVHTVTASGVSSADENLFLTTFNTPTTRGHALTVESVLASGANTLYGVPAALVQSGDFHELLVFANGGESYRGETHYYRAPGNRTVALGPALNNPNLTTVAGSSHLRLRTQLGSQSDYATLLSVEHVQSSREVILTMTNSYHGGTPIQWDVTIPDLSGVPGFPSGALLQSGVNTDWFVEAYGGDAATFFGHPTDGAVLRFAGRGFSTSAAQMARSGIQGRRVTLASRRGTWGGAR